MKRKACFFDIDGTIYNFKVHVQDSTRKAIEDLRANGHLAFISTGRSRAYISSEILDIGFDGVLAACGTYIYYDGKELFNLDIPVETVERSLSVFKKYGVYPVLEGSKWLYLDKMVYPEDKSKGNLFDEIFKDVILPVTGNEGKYSVNKITVFCRTQAEIDCLKSALSDVYDFIQHDLVYMELVPKGYSKGTGITEVCRMLGIAKEDTFAFGDSTNDLEMFEACGTSICMGNGCDEAKAAADHVTGHMEKEGLPDALKYYNLI